VPAESIALSLLDGIRQVRRCRRGNSLAFESVSGHGSLEGSYFARVSKPGQLKLVAEKRRRSVIVSVSPSRQQWVP